MQSNALLSSLTRSTPRARKPTLLASIGRRLLLSQLRHLREGELILREGSQEWRFGKRSAAFDLSAVVEVEDPAFYADAAFGGSIGVGAAYMRERWRCEELTALLRIFVRNRDTLEALDGRWATARKPVLKLFHALNANSRTGSVRNIAAHYDLGNPLYGMMLDETMAYSCAIFEQPHDTLHDAQVAKFDAACRKLRLSPQDHLLEIGTGWGGLAIHAVQRYGCRVTTTTISREQFDYARARIAALGLSDRITLLMQDYRDLQGQYDKLISIEMIEAVGARFLPTYTATCGRLLKPEGAMLLQAITIRDQLYEQALRSVDFIQRFIFPGSFIPSVQAIGNAFADTTDLKILHLEDIGPHYVRTLQEWRRRFFANLAEVHHLGYSAEFVKMWEFYLSYCEAGFAEGQLGDVQVLLGGPRWNLSGCRDIDAYWHP